MVATLAIVATFASVVAARPIARRLSDHPTRADCEAILDRYVEHLVAAENPKPSSALLEERRRAARERAAYHAELARCPEVLTAEEARCALVAHNADEVERCLP